MKAIPSFVADISFADFRQGNLVISETANPAPEIEFTRA